VAPPAAAATAAQPAAASSSAAALKRQQQGALNRLLTKYSADLSQGAAANTLSAIGKQIATAAQALGQHVTLPRAAASSGAVSAPPAAVAAPSTGKVNLTA